MFLVRRRKYKESIVSEAEVSSLLPSLPPKCVLDPNYHLPACQSLIVWVRKLHLQMVSYAADDVHITAPAGNYLDRSTETLL